MRRRHLAVGLVAVGAVGLALAVGSLMTGGHDKPSGPVAPTPHEILTEGFTLGVQDDRLAVAPLDELEWRMGLVDQTGARLTRVDVLWNEVAPTRPAHPTDPNDPAYHWTRYDMIAAGLARRGIAVIFSVYRAPVLDQRRARPGVGAGRQRLRGLHDGAGSPLRRAPARAGLDVRALERAQPGLLPAAAVGRPARRRVPDLAPDLRHPAHPGLRGDQGRPARTPSSWASAAGRPGPAGGPTGRWASFPSSRTWSSSTRPWTPSPSTSTRPPARPRRTPCPRTSRCPSSSPPWTPSSRGRRC